MSLDASELKRETIKKSINELLSWNLQFQLSSANRKEICLQRLNSCFWAQSFRVFFLRLSSVINLTS